MVITRFMDPGELVDNELQLALDDFHLADETRGLVPHYRFRMLHRLTRTYMGNISLRLSSIPAIELYAGHIGYGVEEIFRGHHYAARSVLLLLPHARKHGISPIWITCNPTTSLREEAANWPGQNWSRSWTSRRTTRCTRSANGRSAGTGSTRNF